MQSTHIAAREVRSPWLPGLLLAAWSLAGCGEDVSPPADENDPTEETRETEETEQPEETETSEPTEVPFEGPVHRGETTVSAMVDEGGAELVLGDDAKLVIPKGALDEAVEVSVRRGDADDFDAPLDRPAGESLALVLEPHGLQFDKPVEIVIGLAGSELPATELGLARLDDPQDDTWEILEGSVVEEAMDESELEALPAEDRGLYASRRVSVKSSQFSIYAVAQFAVNDTEVTEKLDVLFVVDDSASMIEEQAALAEQLPRMVRILASGDLEDGETDGNGETDVVDFPPIGDMHLGVVSVNMGVPVDLLGENLPPTPSGQSCVSPGDDGLLQFPDACEGGSADGDYLAFVEGDDVSLLGEDFACISQLGTEGCGFEQQLDSMLKALVSDPAFTFYDGATGNGGDTGANAGFLRDDAALAVIVVTDEEDCSAPDDNAVLFSFATSGTATLTDATTGDPVQMDLATPLNMRCGSYPETQHPIARYVDGLRGLKPDRPDLVLFAAIAGIPPALEGMSTEAILDSDAMQFRSTYPNDPWNPQSMPEASCVIDNPDFDPNQPQEVGNQPYLTRAFPPRRIVQLAGELGDNGVVRSICHVGADGKPDFTPALDVIIEKISNQLMEK